MILLVVGLVAVIVVVLIAVFLSIRLGRGDEHDESDLGPSSRDRRRDQDERWRERDGRQAPSSASRTAGAGGRDSGYGSRGPARERASRNRDYDGARRPSHPQAPGSRRPAAARSAVGASASARGRYDGGPSRQPAAEDYPSSDYPSMDFAPGGRYPSGDHPSAEFPAADYGAMDDPRGRRESRRKPAPAPVGGRAKSRQRGKRDDDSDWPSTEWDKLSDEQYWAELSADKPLSSMARSAKTPNGTAKANGSQAKPAARETRPARPPAPERDLPNRTEPGRPEPRRPEPRRTERGEQWEPATERLPVRGGAREAAPAPPPPRMEADPAASRSHPGPRAVRDTGPPAARESVPQPRAGHRRRDTAGPQPTRDLDQHLAMLTGMASAPPPIPGALQDDPLTSPSFSLKAAPTSDSRSYRNARKHARTTGQPAADGTAQANGNGANGNGSGSYPAGDYADSGYAYHAAPPAVVPPQAPAAEWQAAPPAPMYGNPYQQTGSGNGSAARYPDSQATAGYASYHTDPLRIYSPPGNQTPAPYANPASPPGYQLPSAGTVPYADSYRQHPYPDQAGYQDRDSAGGYAHGFDGSYTGDPYPVDGYRPYPPQG